MTGQTEEQASPNDLQQPLATFNHATEERRFLRREQWAITNYAMIAYAAFAAAPDWLETESWLVPISVLALGLVWAVAFVAYRLLASMQDERNMELDRLHAALQPHLPMISQIWDDNRLYIDRPPKKSTPERKYRKWWQWRGPIFVTQGRYSYAEWLGFFLMLVLGAMVASVIILSRIL